MNLPARAVAACLPIVIAGCSTLGASGPSPDAIVEAGQAGGEERQIVVVPLDENSARRTAAVVEAQRFSDVFGNPQPGDTTIGVGDVLDIAIWEAPPATLFGVTAPGTPIGNSSGQNVGIPQQVVGEDGAIAVPFVGTVAVRGQTPSAVAAAIERRLRGKAHAPQAVVRIVQNESRAVTVIGEVGATRRLPLTARGETLLDAIAAAGGTRQPVGKITMQMTRGGRTASMPLDTIVRDPAQNVTLQPGDVLTAIFQPYSFIALGAVGQNAEIPFEGVGISLAQALGRIGGLRDERANIRGVFLFRMEQAGALPISIAATARQTAEGRVPTVYRLNMGEGSALFTAQDFGVRDGDVIYVSNAPAVDLQKFLNIVSSAAFSVTGIGSAVP
ncbi:polysaccharide biosynthesis/export family protein [Croceicoccus sp. YJ47]|uniref:polysaccharide biosynthesis/export family protein n=1 Tax=Croceicoccus sp. YJ47 TaxID=2798724 RepID=UPI001920EC8E|nr:polysaccharide biosynthesis/export family protein [Croceicoccus sp. YJ47]QQN74309.1 polysaccharide export protein [Croceicoccus sp. YJ47]